MSHHRGPALRRRFAGLARSAARTAWLGAFAANYNEGARPQRLLWASTGTKDPAASDILYVKALVAPFTVNTMPEGTVKAFADHGGIGDTLPPMVATARTYWHNSRKPALISMRWRQNCKTMAPDRSSNPGTN